MKVCDALFSNIKYSVHSGHRISNESSCPSSRQSADGRDSGLKSVSFSSQIIISKTSDFVRSKNRNVCYLLIVLATCTINVSLDMLMGLSPRFRSQFIDTVQEICLASLSIFTSLVLELLLIVQFRILHRFGLQCVSQMQHPPKRQIRTLRNISRSTRFLYFLFVLQIMYWIGFMFGRYDERYSSLLYFSSFLPVLAFHILILDFTKCQVKFVEINYFASPMHHRISLLFGNEQSQKEQAMIVNGGTPIWNCSKHNWQCSILQNSYRVSAVYEWIQITMVPVSITQFKTEIIVCISSIDTGNLFRATWRWSRVQYDGEHERKLQRAWVHFWVSRLVWCRFWKIVTTTTHPNSR